MTSGSADHAALILRLALGAMFIAHALLKAFVFTLPGTAQYFGSLGLPGFLGDVVFAASGALVAARNRMDALGIVLIGVITGIGGGTLRDILLGHPVWWVR